MSVYAEKWGRPLEQAGYLQLSKLLWRRWREIGLSRTERDLIIGIISYQDDPNEKTIPSLKQVAYEAGQCYQTARENIKRLTAYKKDGGKGLLIPVALKQGRTRYNMMPLRRALEKLEQSPALEIVKPAKVRPAPKPEPTIISIVPPDPDAAYQKAYSEPDDDAIQSWEEIKECLKPEISPAAYETWVASTRGLYWDNGDTLVVSVLSTGHQDVLERWRDLIKRCSRRLFGNISIAFKVLVAAAALPI